MAGKRVAQPLMTSSNKQTVTTLIVLFLLSCFVFVALKGIAESPHKNNGSLYNEPVRIADLDNRSVIESSGIAASTRSANIFWTHNDSGDGPFFYAFDREGKHCGVWQVAGAKAQDWEDMAAGPGPNRGQSYIYIGDIGDNSRRREEIVVYRVAEPSIDDKDSASTNKKPGNTEPAVAIRLKYPDGKYDAEALLMHPSTGDLYIVTKVMGATAGVYKLKAPFPKSGVSTLVSVGEIRFPSGHIGLITGGDISPDGRRVVLCDYFRAYEFVLPDEQNNTFDAIWKQTPAAVSLGARRQGEAICYRADGCALLATSEGLPCPLIEVARSSQTQ